MFSIQNFLHGPTTLVSREVAFPSTPPEGSFDAPAHRVYTRDSWEDAWELRENMLCNWAEWCLSPNMPTAEIQWRYGRRVANDNTFLDISPLNENYNPYIKIVFEDIVGGSDRMTWYGKLGSITYRDGGYRTVGGEKVRSGVQTVQCVGMEKTLLDTPITRSKVWDDNTEAAIDVYRGITFNAPLQSWQPGGNRSADEHDGSHLFSNVVREDDAFWSVQHIVKYLLNHCQPSYGGAIADNPLGWFISDDSIEILGTAIWRPVVDTEGRTVKDVLDQLITRKRLMAYYTRVVDDECELVVVSLADQTVVGAGSELLARANANKIDLKFDYEFGDSVIQVNSHEPVDRVRVRGAQARVVCTLSNVDGSLVAGWTEAQEDAYNLGGSELAEYAAAGSYDRMRAINANVRGKEQFKEVYSFFKLPDDWDYTAGNGAGASISNVISPWLDFHTIGYDGALTNDFQREHFICHRIPLKSGYDYSPSAGDDLTIVPVKTENLPHDDRPVYVLMVDHDDKSFEIDKIGLLGHIARKSQTENFEWSGSVSVPDRERGVYVTVVGEPQHIIAKTDFVPLDVDRRIRRQWEWKKMTVTAAIQLQAYCEGIWPERLNATPAGDYVREIVINAGSEYKLDWLHPYTIVGVDLEREPIRNTTGGYINNDSKKLVERARLAYEWYKTPRKSLQITTHKVGDYLPLGYLIEKFGQDEDTNISWMKVNSIVSSIRIDVPSGTVFNQPGAVTQTFLTDYVHQPDFL